MREEHAKSVRKCLTNDVLRHKSRELGKAPFHKHVEGKIGYRPKWHEPETLENVVLGMSALVEMLFAYYLSALREHSGYVN